MLRASFALLLLALVGCAAGVEDPIRMPGDGPSRAPSPETFSAEITDPTIDALREVDSAGEVAAEVQPVPRPMMAEPSFEAR